MEGLFITFVVGEIVEEKAVFSLFVLDVVDDVVDVDGEKDVDALDGGDVGEVVGLMVKLFGIGVESIEFKVKTNVIFIHIFCAIFLI